MVEWKRRRGALTILGALVLGMGLFAVSMAMREPPRREAAVAAPPTLRTVEVRPLPFVHRLTGYGVVRPGESFQAVANVAGRVVERHPQLQSGHLLPAGSLLLAIDPTRYRLAVTAAEAVLAGLQAQQAELDVEATNTTQLIALERERLALAERELERIAGLAESGAVSRTERDAQLRATLAQRQAVQLLQNQLDLLPTRQFRQDAEIDRARAELARARRDLADTRILAPYDLRVAAVDVDLHQHVGVGQRLFGADGIATAEVEAQVSFDGLRRLMGEVRLPGGRDALGLEQRFDLPAIGARGHLVGAEGVTWPARVVRVASGLDPATRAARVVVAVDGPYREVDPPLRPALQRDMYVRVVLSASDPQPRLVVPRTALHDGEVYAVSAAGRLERRAVTVAFTQGDLAVIADGLLPGERVIVDDPAPALDGMAVTAQPDDWLQQEMARQASGAER